MTQHNATNPAEEVTYMATICMPTGATMCVPVEHDMAMRYAELHNILPNDLSEWSEEALDELIHEIEPDDVESYQRALILLAHHRSERASELIAELRPNLTPDLAQFAEMAYAESLNWLGLDYVRQLGWETPLITPAGQAVRLFEEPTRH